MPASESGAARYSAGHRNWWDAFQNGNRSVVLALGCSNLASFVEIENCSPCCAVDPARLQARLRRSGEADATGVRAEHAGVDEALDPAAPLVVLGLQIETAGFTEQLDTGSRLAADGDNLSASGCEVLSCGTAGTRVACVIVSSMVTCTSLIPISMVGR